MGLRKLKKKKPAKNGRKIPIGVAVHSSLESQAEGKSSVVPEFWP